MRQKLNMKKKLFSNKLINIQLGKKIPNLIPPRET